MNPKKLFLGLLAVSVLSIGWAAVPQAAADQYGRYGRWDNSRPYERWNDRSDLRRERAELQRDLAELERDRADLRRMYRNGASRAAIERKKEEIRRGLGEVREGQRDIRRDRYDSGGWYNRPWWSWDHGGWRRR